MKGRNARKESGIVRTAHLIAWELSVSGSTIGRVIAEWKDPNHLQVYGNSGLKFNERIYSPDELPDAIGLVGDEIVRNSKYPNFKVVPVAYNGHRHELTSHIKSSQTSYSRK